ncbi:MAG: mannose-1-phosphate guanylyltransferase [Clostridium sp.]|nr:mannose-1-phosphate guanylyltransferase [Clostridium sp.]
MINPHRYCVIMCGGIGSRFWPYSRADKPKQFIDFLGTGRSLLQMTFDRVLNVVRPENIYIVTNVQYASLIAEQLPELPAESILCEPARRNTAPCIAWATWTIAARDPEASILVTPSDHMITRENIFVDCLARGFEFVEQNDALLTLGIQPTRPETGFGYIQEGPEAAPGILRVKTFTEKPSLELAKVFIESGDFLWNSGLFLWRASVIKEAFRHYAPDWIGKFDDNSSLFGTPAEAAFIRENFAGCPSISIDFAIMEKADNVYVERGSFGWTDLGTWSALYDNSPKNQEQNVTQNCQVMAYNSRGNIFAVSDPSKLVVVSGLDDCIVADAGDVLLICPKSEEQRIKQFVNDVESRYDDKYL